MLIAYRYFPLEVHERAFPAAIAAECAAEQGAFWAYHDKLFTEGGDLSDARLIAMAAALNLDRGRFAECLKSQKARQVVEASFQDAADKGLEAAPAVFLNGFRISEPLDYEGLKARIARALDAAPAIPSAPPVGTP